MLAACGEASDAERVTATASPLAETSPEPAPAWFKDTAPFIVHDDGKSLEARLENMQGLITPVRYFFVRNNSVSLDVDVESWRLSIEGDAVSNPDSVDVRRHSQMPSRTLVSYLECAGNHRAMFDLVNGQKASGHAVENRRRGEWGVDRSLAARRAAAGRGHR